MQKDRRDGQDVPAAEWATLEEWARLQVQEFLQRLLEEEVTELLGRRRCERRQKVDASCGYRNGYQEPRRLSMQGGTITVRRPRVRNLEQKFESQILPLFRRRTEEVGRLLPELYLHGLSLGDFELALRGLLGEGRPFLPLLSPASKPSGRCSTRPGASGRSPTGNRSTCGRTAST